MIKQLKKKFKDIAVQKMQTKEVLSRSEIEKLVIDFSESFNSGVVYYTSSGKNITIYTSDLFSQRIENFIKGETVLNPNLGKTGIIISDKPYFLCGSLCVTVDFDGKKNSYDCEFFM